MVLARVLNAPHCLQASIETTTPGFCVAGEVLLLATGFFALTGDASFFLGGDLTDVVEVRVARAMVDKSRGQTRAISKDNNKGERTVL